MMLLKALVALAVLAVTFQIGAADKTTYRKVAPWNLTMAVTERVPDGGSDYFLYSFKLIDQKGTVVGASDWGYGPFLVSAPNKQVVSCEGGGVDQGAAARYYDLRATIVRTLKHEGTLVACGITKDQLLYWLHYSDYENTNSTPMADWKRVSLIKIVDSSGTEIHRATLRTAGKVLFKYNGRRYELTFDEPPHPF